MKKVLPLFFIILATYTSVYSSDGDKKPFKRVYVGLSFTPEVSYHYLVNNYIAPGSSSSNNQSIISMDNHQGSPQFGLDAQFKVGINLTHWLAIESGVGYMLAQYKYQSSGPLTFGSSWTGTGPITATDTLTTKEKEIYQYMTVPIGLRFSMGHRKVRGIIAAGVDLDFLFKQKETTTQTDVNGAISNTSTTVETKNFNTFNVSPYLGVGIDCYFSPGAVLRLMPVAQIQGLKNINTPISEYLWNVGFNVAFLFGL